MQKSKIIGACIHWMVQPSLLLCSEWYITQITEIEGKRKEKKYGVFIVVRIKGWDRTWKCLCEVKFLLPEQLPCPYQSHRALCGPQEGEDFCSVWLQYTPEKHMAGGLANKPWSSVPSLKNRTGQIWKYPRRILDVRPLKFSEIRH